MYLLDTNICIAIIDRHPQALNKFTRQSYLCYIPTVVQAELYKGAYCSQKVEPNLEILNLFTDLLEIVDFDREAALEFGKIQSELRRKGKPTGDLDALIAAVARSRNDILVTNNTRHFINIDRLQLEDWLSSRS
ncbi:MAG: type II toxin-antitoxin system VapC family toxin [Cyanobacteria bacterium J06648_1]